MFVRSSASLRENCPRKSEVNSSAQSNFAGRLMERLGQDSVLADAATGRIVGPEDLPRLIAGYAASLREAGMKEGDRLLIGCTISIPSALVYLGALYAGLVAVPVEDRAVRESAAMLFETTGAKAVWTETVLPRDRAGTASTICFHGEFGDGDAEIQPPAARTAMDLAALMATSGSTGVPRFVMVSHGNLIANTEAIIRSQRLGAAEKGMLILPLNYCFGTSVLHTHLYQGGGVIFDRRFMFPDKVLCAIAQWGCTTFAGVPTAYNVLLKRSKIREIPMPTLRRFLQ